MNGTANSKTSRSRVLSHPIVLLGFALIAWGVALLVLLLAFGCSGQTAMRTKRSRLCYPEPTPVAIAVERYDEHTGLWVPASYSECKVIVVDPKGAK